jgi:16S rRNA (cytidine1402-2'-O)-methyltransferase
MVGTLYVVRATAGDARDLTRRAARILGEVSLVVANDEGHAQWLLDECSIASSLVTSGKPAVLDALETGDLALLISGSSPAPAGSDHRLICLAVERGFPVVPIPGPSLPLSALVVSGLPADSFVYLGELPLQQPDCQDLLASLSAEPRTLLITTMPQSLPVTLKNLHTTLGSRPVVVVSASGEGIEVVWRGTLDGSPDPMRDLRVPGCLILVVGGAREQSVLWAEERLRAEIKAGLAKALGVKEISRKLAAESGWSSREIYRLAVEMGQSGTAAGWDSHGGPTP